MTENVTVQQSLFAASEVELVYKTKVKPADRPKIVNSKSCYDLLLAHWDMSKIELVEQVYLLLLDRNNKCLGLSQLFTGGLSSCVVDPKIVYTTALKANASSIVLAHNHPSGHVQPSQADNLLTHRIRNAGDILDLRMLDHLIIAPQDYYSYADSGYEDDHKLIF